MVLDCRWVKHFGKWDRTGPKSVSPDRSPPTGTARSTDNTSGPSQVNSRFTMADVGVALRAPSTAGIPRGSRTGQHAGECFPLFGIGLKQIFLPVSFMHREYADSMGLGFWTINCFKGVCLSREDLARRRSNELT